MLILGAGLSGLIGAHALRHHKPMLLEAQPSLPHNHSALLRFRSDAIARITGAPMRKVRVLKAVMSPDGGLYDNTTLLHANAYARKVSGAIAPRSILDLSPVDRWVAGPDFTERMAHGLNIQYGIEYVCSAAPSEDPIVSTLPINFWLKKLGQSVELKAYDITTITYELDCDIDIYQTIYWPWQQGHLDRVYRASYHGSRLIVECTNDELPSQDTIEEIYQWFTDNTLGFEPPIVTTPIVRVQKRGKIVPLLQAVRQHVVSTLTDRYNVYSLGRYATWRQLLLDDLVRDVEVIDQLIEQGSYRRKLQYAAQ